ncbi:NAD(P)H-dependent oxidoreductase [Colwellia psychrerythraea]|uniref:NADPH-dependent FMN reductase n=1 Tax=Colwellia psychrerythraea TaxID=28229 RepID=A0A099L6B3_COLPS|nr:NAD(P)H-dependent oxidoreductase [Colwellia psychrerythraea]KGJ97657.1 NADPH-dependent FMN reductase [Colwellia psychrerythraea]
MNLLIISASQRTQSQSAKVANYIAETSSQFSETNHIELCKQRLPMWDGEDDSKQDNDSDWLAINSQLQKMDALILITPEWGGTASPLLKNLLMMAQATDIGHKPVLIVSVVNGISGAYPVAELRMNAFSNNKLVAIPDHLIIRNVEDILNTFKKHNQQEDKVITRQDKSIRHRIGYSLHTLLHYSQAMKTLRDSLRGNIYNNEHLYPYGM